MVERGKIFSHLRNFTFTRDLMNSNFGTECFDSVLNLFNVGLLPPRSINVTAHKWRIMYLTVSNQIDNGLQSNTQKPRF
jgi:hypothetical protein